MELAKVVAASLAAAGLAACVTGPPEYPELGEKVMGVAGSAYIKPTGIVCWDLYTMMNAANLLADGNRAALGVLYEKKRCASFPIWIRGSVIGDYPGTGVHWLKEVRVTFDGKNLDLWTPAQNVNWAARYDASL